MSDKIPVGECPEHGYVYGDDVDYRFPNPSLCHCGEELAQCTLAEPERVEELAA